MSLTQWNILHFSLFAGSLVAAQFGGWSMYVLAYLTGWSWAFRPTPSSEG